MHSRDTQLGPLFGLDVGNTSVKCAVGPGPEWRLLFRAPTAPADTLAERMVAAFAAAETTLPAGAACVVCSVHPDADAAAVSFWNRIGGPTDPKFLGSDLPIPMPARVRRPERVGRDRLLLALGARAVAGAPCIVVSAGTAITVDLVDADGFFAGGAIAPGFGLAADALHENTAFLPRVEPAPPHRTPGTDTEDAIRNGVYWSCVGGVLSLVDGYRQTLGGRHAPVVCTGSDAHLLVPALPEGDVRTDASLIFKGMDAALRQR